MQMNAELLDSKILATGAKLSAAQADLTAHPLFSEIDGNGETSQSAWIEEETRKVDAHIQEAENQEASYRKCLIDNEKLKEEYAVGAQTEARLKDELVTANTALQTTSERIAAANKQLDDISNDLDTCLSQMDETIISATGLTKDEWRIKWNADPDGFASQLNCAAQEWHRHQESLSKSRAQANTLRTTAVSALERIQSELGQALLAREKRTQANKTLEVDAQRRRGLLSGQQVDDVERVHETQIATARQQHLQAVTALNRTLNSISTSETLATKNQNLQFLLTKSLRASEITLETWKERIMATGCGIADEAELDELLEIEFSWIRAEQEWIAAMDQSVMRAEATYAERLRAADEHAKERPQDSDSTKAQASLSLIVDTEIPRLSADLSKIQVAISMDDEVRSSFSGLIAQIDVQRVKTKIWTRLADVLGSADGKKFRNYAQQMTMDVLLTYANEHLEMLSRRYRLERIPKGLGLMVVDQDMADEMRSVHSLSGGESFLVSLALALGLASMSSHRVPISSLFIDEGFGSLDATSVAIAMDALDSLQSQGRQVGVITHIEEMTERIGARINVVPATGGASKIEVFG